MTSPRVSWLVVFSVPVGSTAVRVVETVDRLRVTMMIEIRNTTTPAPMRRYPTRCRSTPGTVRLRANATIAPTTKRKIPVPIPMMSPSSAALVV